MPELPEVEFAASVARRVAVGRTITSVSVHHRAQRKHLPPRHARSLQGDRVLAVVRRGKGQVFHLASGRELRVHFRMTGDWLRPDAGGLPATVRAVIDFDDGGRLALDDPRALSVISLCDVPDEDHLGLDALDPALTGSTLAPRLARRRIPVKVALLDQSVIAGVGNIYASEALWRAQINPRTPANRLGVARLADLVRHIRATLRDAIRRQERYYRAGKTMSDAGRFKVYDREGKPCLRCGTAVRRITQSARSTYFCPNCQKKS